MTTAPRTWVVGEVVTAALLNAELRDQLTDILGAWTSYTPVWAATTTPPSVGNGTLTGRHKLIGKLCTAVWELVMGSTTTFGSGTYSWSLPFTAASPGGTSSVFSYIGAGRGHAAVWYAGSAGVTKGGSTARIYSQSGTQEWSPTTPVTWAANSGNYLHGQVTYEIA